LFFFSSSCFVTTCQKSAFYFAVMVARCLNSRLTRQKIWLIVWPMLILFFPR
jgi:hypothetical protein